MTKRIVFFMVLSLVSHLYLLSTSTMYCECKKEDYVIRLHVNSQDRVVDLSILIDENLSYHYYPEEFDKIEFTWERYEKPFTGNKMKIVYKKKDKSKPAFVIKVKGEHGTIVFNGKKCKILCDWRR